MTSTRRSLVKLGLAVSILLDAHVALGQDPLEPPPDDPVVKPGGGLELGLRVAYGLPFGSSGNWVSGPSEEFSDWSKAMVPFWVDAGYRFNSSWYAGAFFQYGLGFSPISRGCDLTGVGCSVRVVRFGLDVLYHFSPDKGFDPWAGIGAGYEILTLSSTVLGTSVSSSLSGFELGNAQLGGDFRIHPNFTVGPFVTLTLARFSNASSGSASGSITGRSLHQWLMLGMRGAFRPSSFSF